MVGLDGETHDPLHVDVTVRNGGDVRQMFRRVQCGIGGDFRLHRRSIPCQNDIGEQGKGPTDGIRIILGSPVLGLNPPGEQCALEGVERFTLGQQAMNLPPEFGIDEIVEHEHAAHNLADQSAAFIDRASARGTAMSLDDR